MYVLEKVVCVFQGEGSVILHRDMKKMVKSPPVLFCLKIMTCGNTNLNWANQPSIFKWRSHWELAATLWLQALWWIYLSCDVSFVLKKMGVPKTGLHGQKTL